MNELKPCPFCGGEARIRDFTMVDLEPEIDVFCINCGAQTFVYETKDDAIEAWNRRVEDSDIERLRKKVSALEKSNRNWRRKAQKIRKAAKDGKV